MTRAARRRSRRWIAAEFRLQVNQIDEDVRLATQFVGDHRRMAGDRGYDGDVDATTLHGFDQAAEIAVAGK